MNEGSEHETKILCWWEKEEMRWDEKWKNCENSHSDTPRHSRKEWSCTQHTICGSSINSKLWRFSFLFSFCLAQHNNKAESWNFSSDCSFKYKFNKILFLLLLPLSASYFALHSNPSKTSRRRWGISVAKFEILSWVNLNWIWNSMSSRERILEISLKCKYFQSESIHDWATKKKFLLNFILMTIGYRLKLRVSASSFSLSDIVG